MEPNSKSPWDLSEKSPSFLIRVCRRVLYTLDYLVPVLWARIQRWGHHVYIIISHKISEVGWRWWSDKNNLLFCTSNILAKEWEMTRLASYSSSLHLLILPSSSSPSLITITCYPPPSSFPPFSFSFLTSTLTSTMPPALCLPLSRPSVFASIHLRPLHFLLPYLLWKVWWVVYQMADRITILWLLYEERFGRFKTSTLESRHCELAVIVWFQGSIYWGGPSCPRAKKISQYFGPKVFL